MKKFILLLLVISSCSSSKKLTINDLKQKNQLYGVKNNPYYYFMIDSVGNKHLVRTHMFNSRKVIWTENLIRQ